MVSGADSFDWVGCIDVLLPENAAATGTAPYINVHGRTYEEALFLRQVVMQAVEAARQQAPIRMETNQPSASGA